MVKLVYQDAKSHKFWHIEVSGDQHTVTYGRVGTKGQSKTKRFDSPAMCRKDADRLIATKKKKGYAEHAENENQETAAPAPTSRGSTRQESAQKKKTAQSVESTVSGSLTALTVKSLVQDYDWGDLADGHRHCPALLSQLNDQNAETVAGVIKLALEAFTFVSGGGWCPDWMEGQGRHDGSGLNFVVDALALLKTKDESLWVRWATRALPYIMCEGEAIDHDEGEAWEAYETLSAALAPCYLRADKTFETQQTLESLAKQLDAISRAHVRGDPLRTSVALLQSKVNVAAKETLVELMLAFVVDNDFGMLDWADSCGGLNPDAAKAYGQAIESNEVAGGSKAKLLAATLSGALTQGSQFKCGRAVGPSASEFYWFGIHKKHNDHCPIFYFDGKVQDIGSFTQVPKVMCWSPEGLYFANGTSVYRYDRQGAWVHEFDAGFKLFTLARVRGEVMAIGGKSTLCRKGDAGWSTFDFDSTAKFGGIAGGPDGSLWLAGTAGTILVIGKDGAVRTLASVDKKKGTYFLVATENGVYVRCQTGLYRVDGKKAKKVVKESVTDAAFAQDSLWVTTKAGELLRVDGDKVVERWPVACKFVTALGDALAITLADRLAIYDGNSWSGVAPNAPKSNVVALPAPPE